MKPLSTAGPQGQAHRPGPGPLTLLPAVAWCAVVTMACTGAWVALDAKEQALAWGARQGLADPVQVFARVGLTAHLTVLMAVTFVCLLGVAWAAWSTQRQLRRYFNLQLAALPDDEATRAAAQPLLNPETLLQTAEHVRWTALQVVTATAGLAAVAEALAIHARDEWSAQSTPPTPSVTPSVTPSAPPATAAAPARPAANKLSLAWPLNDSSRA